MNTEDRKQIFIITIFSGNQLSKREFSVEMHATFIQTLSTVFSEPNDITDLALQALHVAKLLFYKTDKTVGTTSDQINQTVILYRRYFSPFSR